MNLIYYGVAFIVVGIWQAMRERKMRKGHTHRCAKCGTIWQHGRSDETEGDWKSTREWLDAHTCPKCGAERFQIDGFAKVAPEKRATPVAVAVRQPSTAGAAADQPAQAKAADAPQAPARVPPTDPVKS